MKAAGFDPPLFLRFGSDPETQFVQTPFNLDTFSYRQLRFTMIDDFVGFLQMSCAVAVFLVSLESKFRTVSLTRVSTVRR